MKIIVAILLLASLFTGAGAAKSSVPLLDFTEFRTDLPGGRHANVRTMRAVVARVDGSERREAAAVDNARPELRNRRQMRPRQGRRQ